jgi:hypothetical protein
MSAEAHVFLYRKPSRSLRSSRREPAASAPDAHWQTLSVQCAELQSASEKQRFVEAQGTQLGPPQSTSVSVPFRAPSLQVGAWQTLPEQTEVTQSVPARQCLVTAHRPHAPPPQSMSVSAPF